MIGDANLCSDKWNNPKFIHQMVADELKSTIKQCGLEKASTLLAAKTLIKKYCMTLPILMQLL